MRTVGVLLAALLAAATAQPGAITVSWADTPGVVTVTPSQSATVIGDFPSLRGLVSELCRQSGIELRAFEATDRPVRVRYEGVALPAVFAGLLRQESYLLGVTAGDGNAVRVSWLQIVAGEAGPASAAAGADAPLARPMPVMSFEVPAKFGEVEFTSEDPEQRARALQSVANRLLADPALLATDPSVLAATLAAYPHAGELLRQLRDGQEDPELRARLDAIVAALP